MRGAAWYRLVYTGLRDLPRGILGVWCPESGDDLERFRSGGATTGETRGRAPAAHGARHRGHHSQRRHAADRSSGAIFLAGTLAAGDEAGTESILPVERLSLP